MELSHVVEISPEELAFNQLPKDEYVQILKRDVATAMAKELVKHLKESVQVIDGREYRTYTVSVVPTDNIHNIISLLKSAEHSNSYDAVSIAKGIANNLFKH